MLQPRFPGGLGTVRLDSLDQRSRQSKRATQFRFLAGHFTIIALMIEARQMKNSVQRQNLDFLRYRMPELD
jgi:hypothetical protein